MRCPQCQAEVMENDQFCYSCGAGLSRPAATGPGVRRAAACPQCGQPLQPGDKFCGYCGAVVSSPEKAAPVQPAPPKERTHGFAAFLGYMNFLVCLVMIAATYILLLSPTFEDSFVPFLLARFALISLFGGMLIFGIYLGTRKNRTDRRHAKIIFILSLLGIAAGVFLFT